MKKTLFVLSAFFLFFVVAFSVAAGGGSQAVTSSGTVTLDFPTWQWEEAGVADFWKEIKATFERKHANAIVQINGFPYAQYTPTLITRFSAGDPPDIVHIPSATFYQFASQGWFSSLDNDFAGTDILQSWTALQRSMVYNGQNQGLLLVGYGFVLYCNEKILQEAGVGVPTTSAEFINAVKAVDALNKDYSGYGLTTLQHPNVFTEFSQFIVGYGSSIVKDGKYNFNDPILLQAAEDYRVISSSAPKGISSEMMYQMFVDGKIAMFIAGPHVSAMFNNADAALKPFLKITKPPFPVVPGNISNSLHIASELKGAKRDLVVDFIKTMAEPGTQLRYSNLARMPAGRSSVAAQITDPLLKIANDLSVAAVGILPQSEKLMVNYGKYSDEIANAILRMQMADRSVTTASILSELEANLNREGLTP